MVSYVFAVLQGNVKMELLNYVFLHRLSWKQLHQGLMGMMLKLGNQ
jgi:hypothetical protein